MEDAKPRPFGGAVAGASPLGVSLSPPAPGHQNYYASYSHSTTARDLEMGCTKIYAPHAPWVFATEHTEAAFGGH